MRILSQGDGEAATRGDGREPAQQHPQPSSPLLEISNATVRLYKGAFGRGPTQARARFAGPDTLVVLLQDTMTVSERKLASLGEHERVRSHRLLLHGALEDDIRGVVEEILERPTLGVISGIDTQRDVAAEVIMLAPGPHLDSIAPA
jgi:uncharacterized protein YbcI